MDLLGVGPLELVFILLIIFLILGPDDLAATGKKLGRFLNTVRKSEFWQGVTEVSKEVRSLPNTLMREAQLEETKKELEKDLSEVKQIAKEFEGDVKAAHDLQRDLIEGMQVEVPEFNVDDDAEESTTQEKVDSTAPTEAAPDPAPVPEEAREEVSKEEND